MDGLDGPSVANVAKGRASLACVRLHDAELVLYACS
jgi:hypothetical protein